MEILQVNWKGKCKHPEELENSNAELGNSGDLY
jgi:hypothetical protein